MTELRPRTTAESPRRSRRQRPRTSPYAATVVAPVSSAQLETPVALFVFNRPATTRAVLEAVASARPKSLLVVADGPRSERSNDQDLCRETRRLIDDVSWPCDIVTNYSDDNLGCDERIVSGLDWVFSRVDRAIVLEDDCVPDVTFFPFCEELLDRYSDDRRVYTVRGFSPVRPRRPTDTSYHFSRINHTWGWATWARAWRHYDREMRRWRELRETNWLHDRMPTAAHAQVVKRLFDERYAGEHSWDYQWEYSALVQDGVAAVPNCNLVRNVGFGPGGTHLVDPSARMAAIASKTSPMAFPLRHPTEVTVSRETDRRELRLSMPGRGRRLLARTQRLMQRGA